MYEVNWQSVLDVIPQGTQTLSKAPHKYVNGIYPKQLWSGHGAEVYDENGNAWVDYISSLGAILLGYKHPSVDLAVKETITNGQVLLSLPHEKEVQLAKKLIEIIPGAEQARFFKTGSEATSAAIRLCRAYTDREIVLACGYHGWHDWFQIAQDQKAGIPICLENKIIKFKYNDLEELERWLEFDNVAAVILEPIIIEEPKNNFLWEAVKMAHEHGALVIFDEIITGFRFGLGGASKYFGVTPDLMTLSKGMGNGYAISAVVGKKEIMSTWERPDFFCSGTFGGELIGITAALAVINILQATGMNVWSSGLNLKRGFNQICAQLNLEDITCDGLPPRTVFSFNAERHKEGHKALFWQECCKRGVLVGYNNFVTLAHTADIILNTLNKMEDALKVVKENWKDPIGRLEGDMPQWIIIR